MGAINKRRAVSLSIQRESRCWIFKSLVVLAFFALAQPNAQGAGRNPLVGQWIWSMGDRGIFLRSRKNLPHLAPAVWVSTLSFADGEVVQKRALSPAIAKVAPVALVVRLDESFHRVWGQEGQARIASAVNGRLDDLLAHVKAAGATISEIQLDYDCPVRHLAHWATVVKALTAGVLAGREVWVTSLVVQMESPEYGDLFRGSVAGHILQVFDTGERLAPGTVDRISRSLTAQRMPFRLGVGAFERRLLGVIATDHRLWFSSIPVFSQNSWFRGVWVFPAGNDWLSFMKGFP